MAFFPSILLRSLLLTGVVFLPGVARAIDDYQPGPDSIVQPGVPTGELITFELADSKIFPGTTREVTIYVPRQYDPARPACLYVTQDGVIWNTPVVLDNLIAKGDVPVMIGVFIKPGVVKPLNAEKALPRFNRSFEYDGLGDAYVRFILDEVLPEVRKRTTADGRPIRFSDAANDRAIAGSSSGAIAAFNAAWERPDAFSRIFSAVGTFVGLRGGDRFPVLIRKSEPKPLRVFLQDGSNDNNIYAGDWWMANQTMERALVFAGYEVNHNWGDGRHSGKHATAIHPDVLRWLWHDWPKPIKKGASKNDTLVALLLPGEEWQQVGEGYAAAEGPAANDRGEVFFTDGRNGKTYRIDPNRALSPVATEGEKGGAQAFAPDGRRYVLARDPAQVVASSANGKTAVVAEGLNGHDLVVAHNGNCYLTEPPAVGSTEPSKVWLIKPTGEKQVVDTGLRYASGITLSPDQSLLYVADARSHWVYSYQIQPDGTLGYKQRYYWLHEADPDDQTFAGGLCVDREGRLFVATALGIQVADQAGRVRCIIPTPNGKVTGLCFGGMDFDTLYATCGDKVYGRKFNTQGANAWAAPFKPAPPKL